MKKTYWFRLAVTVAAPLLMAISVRAAELFNVSDYDSTEVAGSNAGLPAPPSGLPAAPSVEQAAAGGEQATMGGEQAAGCNSCTCNGCLKSGCDDCRSFECYGFCGADSFKGASNYVFNGSNGFFSGLNAGFALPGLCKYGIGGQAGMSGGIYDFSGRLIQSEGQTEQQVFVTTGIFHRADGNLPISAGIVYDWMFNTNFGFLADDPTLSQWRWQMSYQLNDCNEVGVWGTQSDRSFMSGVTGVTYRPINQVDLFWRHKFGECGADGRLYIGLPTESQAPSSGSVGGKPGSFILGANIEAPLSDRLSLFANGTYMAPNEGAGPSASTNETWDVSFGINIYLGCSRSRTATVAGNCFMPYLPVANNGSFLVDTNIRGL